MQHMNDNSSKPPSRRIGYAWIAVISILLLPFVLLAIALLDDHLFHTHVPFKVYRAIGIWEPLEGLYFMLTK